MFREKSTGTWALLLAAGISFSVWMAEARGAGVQLTEQKDKVRVEINGEFFTDYVFEGAPHVYY
jgi:hypothetical protein